MSSVRVVRSFNFAAVDVSQSRTFFQACPFGNDENLRHVFDKGDAVRLGPDELIFCRLHVLAMSPG